MVGETDVGTGCLDKTHLEHRAEGETRVLHLRLVELVFQLLHPIVQLLEDGHGQQQLFQLGYWGLKEKGKLAQLSHVFSC